MRFVFAVTERHYAILRPNSDATGQNNILNRRQPFPPRLTSAPSMMFPQHRSKRSIITGLTAHRLALSLPLFFSHLAAFFPGLITGRQMDFLTIFYVLTES
ncbi:hypothetical protein MXF20_10965 [Pantoea dispersa]|uniref:hypothetical protein n=1 Tax=Pantoea dispersa TaxID=59814 RepID=UPI002DBECAF5|nr:hypothetical protein [Pantoea dispersa]MEB5972606.1 hypothetical protein [Pantoea dispersa]